MKHRADTSAHLAGDPASASHAPGPGPPGPHQALITTLSLNVSLFAIALLMRYDNTSYLVVHQITPDALTCSDDHAVPARAHGSVYSMIAVSQLHGTTPGIPGSAPVLLTIFLGVPAVQVPRLLGELTQCLRNEHVRKPALINYSTEMTILPRTQQPVRRDGASFTHADAARLGQRMIIKKEPIFSAIHFLVHFIQTHPSSKAQHTRI